MSRYKIINNVEYDISLNISPFKNEKKKKKCYILIPRKLSETNLNSGN